MKQQIMKKKLNNSNIPLRRKLAVIYSRVLFIIKISIFVIIYLLIFTKYLNSVKDEAANYLYKLTAQAGFRLENVLIEGQLNTNFADIVATLNAHTGTPIFAIDINKIQRRLTKNPWIKAVAVERQLPKTIYIAILEKVPIAIWQINHKLYLIDEDGAIIAKNNIAKFINLPHVVGVEANIYAAQLIKDLAQFPKLAATVTSAVRYGERRWNLNLAENITVKMPNHGFNVALKYLHELYRAGKLFNSNYKTIDLRDASKYYIEKF